MLRPSYPFFLLAMSKILHTFMLRTVNEYDGAADIRLMFQYRSLKKTSQSIDCGKSLLSSLFASNILGKLRMLNEKCGLPRNPMV